MSYGIGCARNGYPGAYTRVSCFTDWIAAQYNIKNDQDKYKATTATQSKDWDKPCPADANTSKGEPTLT